MARRFWFCASGIISLSLGAWIGGSGSARTAPFGAPPFGAVSAAVLMDLHLHGSLSEGTGTMAQHTEQAERHGYDGLWWTDHLARNLADAMLAQRIRFEGSAVGDPHPWLPQPPSEFELLVEKPGSAALDFPGQGAPQGASYGRFALAAAPADGWIRAELAYRSASTVHRKSLFAEPILRSHLRLEQQSGDATLLLRLILSSEPDGATKVGIPRVIEFFLAGVAAPAPEPNVVRVPLDLDPDWSQWECDVAELVRNLMPGAPDLALLDFSLCLAAQRGGEIRLGVDDFRYEHDAPMDVEIFRAQERYVAANLSARIFHHVGLEVEQPLQYALPGASHGDHLIALYPDRIPAVPLRRPGDPLAEQHPRGTVDWLQQQHATVIFAHPFGSSADSHMITPAEAAARRARVLAHRAFGADGIEVGYYQRGRPLDELVELWDALSAAGCAITGVGVSDNHSVQPWQVRENHMGTWIRSGSVLAADLAAAVKAGDVFFGDPFRFDPQGDFLLDAADGSYRMGDMVAIAGGSELLRARVSGARGGDRLILLRDGVAVAQGAPLAGSDGALRAAIPVQPGDWVRAELRGPGGEPILFSNPVYFVGHGDHVPPHREP